MKLKYLFLISTLLFSIFYSCKKDKIENVKYSMQQIGGDIICEAPGDFFGQSVSLSSDGLIIAIGAWGNDGNGIDAGHVRIYQYFSGNWTQIGNDIDGEAAGDAFGSSVSLSSEGSRVAIGAPGNDGNGSGSGRVRIFQNQSGTWTQVGNDIDGEAEGDFSGYPLSLSANGSQVAIGAYLNDGNGTASGHVRVYKNISGIWTQIGNDIDGEAEGDKSGESVSLSSDGMTVAIGATLNDDNGFASGHVRIYKNISGMWTQVGNDINGESENDHSGKSVSLSSDGSIIAIGAPYNNGKGDYAGHVRIYQNKVGTWSQLGQDIDGEAEGDFSGYSLSINNDGSTLVIGALWNQDNGIDAGHVRIYKNISGNWTKAGDDIDGDAKGDLLGASVSMNGDGSKVAVGAPSSSTDSGYVRVYNIVTTINDQ